jgi:hypothetical protein
MNQRPTASIGFLLVLLFIGVSYSFAGEPVLPPSVSERPTFSKPFWIEKTMFVVDDTLFVVGLATKASTLEEGRARSLEAAKEELRGRSKMIGEAKWQDVDTKDIYEEREPDGTFTVWRLVAVKTHGYNAFILNPEQAKQVAKILSRIEEKKLRAAKDEEIKELGENLKMKRNDVASHFNRRVDAYNLTWMCDGGKGRRESCETLEELDLQIAQLEAEGWKWSKFRRNFDPPASYLYNMKTKRYEPPDPNNKDQFKPLPHVCYSGLSWIHFKWLQLIGTCRD